MAKKIFYITTSIAYTNASPHIGFALELVQADVYARYKKQKGEKVFFLTGTDEHGSKIEKTARTAKKSPQTFVNSIAKEFKALKKTLNISWSDFIRTTDKKRHWPAVFKLWKELEKNNDIYKKKYRGLYCIGCEKFLTEKELIDGKCPDHLTKPEALEEENYFFKLSKYAKEIELRIKNKELRIIPESRANEILAMLKDGVADLSVSRPKEKLNWGIPVPGDKKQIIYVWIDALSNYISAIGYNAKGKIQQSKFRNTWPADAHFIGKDILKFHAIVWPALLLSARLPLPKNIFVHGYITADGQKMSKSLGNVVPPNDLVKKYGIDATRYFLLKEIPSAEDGDFSETKFKERYNGELANGLGNFSARVLTLASRYLNLKIPILNQEINQKIEETKIEAGKKIEGFKYHEALAAIWDLIKFGDNYVNQTKPWEKPENKKTEVANLILILESVGKLIEPFLPQTSKEILKNIKKSGKTLRVKKGKILFPRIN